MRSLCKILMAIAIALASLPASAADPMAESLFQEALALMGEGRFRDACPKLEASQRLEAKSGTMTVLASCNEQIGKIATAWAQYKEAAAIARTEGRKEHVDKATELAAALELRLGKLRIDAQTPQGGVQLTVELNGSVVPEAIFGIAFAIDPGTYTLAAMAPGKQTWSATVEIKGQLGTTTVAIPELEAEKPVAPPPPMPAPTLALPPQAPPPKPVVVDRRIPPWAWVVGAGGLVSVGVSAGFLVDQRLASSTLDDRCGGAARDRCTPGYDFAADHAREKRDFGMFLGFGIGGLGLAAASVIGIVTVGPSSTSTTSRRATITPWLGPDAMGASVELGF